MKQKVVLPPQMLSDYYGERCRFLHGFQKESGNLWMRKLTCTSLQYIQHVTFVSRTSYGMYLSHVLIISVFVRIGIDKQMPIALVPVLMVFSILCIETVMMFTINKLKFSKYLGG